MAGSCLSIARALGGWGRQYSCRKATGRGPRAGGIRGVLGRLPCSRIISRLARSGNARRISQTWEMENRTCSLRPDVVPGRGPLQ